MTDTANKAKILIVDDEKDITAILKSGLQEHGFSVDDFNDPRGILSHFISEHYDKLNGVMTICILTKSYPSAD